MKKTGAAAIATFTGMKLDEAERLLPYFTERSLEKDQELFHKGDTGSSMAIIDSEIGYTGGLNLTSKHGIYLKCVLESEGSATKAPQRTRVFSQHTRAPTFTGDFTFISFDELIVSDLPLMCAQGGGLT